jgi:hypothetical protein
VERRCRVAGAWNRRAAAVLIIGLVALAPIQGAACELYQNEPEPFCNDTQWGPETSIFRFSVDELANVKFEIWGPDTVGVFVSIGPVLLQPGVWEAEWDGTGCFPDPCCPEGAYPYHLMATRPDSGGTVLCDQWHLAHISCESPVQNGTWGRIKARFRLAEPDTTAGVSGEYGGGCAPSN